MSCIICGAKTELFLRKRFNEFDLGDVDYSRCSDCGFVLSETHAEMSDSRWEGLNRDFHESYQGSDDNPVDPRWLPRLRAQAQALQAANDAGLLPAGRRLDYACGDGKLSEMLAESSDISLECYDRYMHAPHYLQDGDMQPGSFDFVISTSVFEHLRSRENLDNIRSLLAPRGVMAMHTLVCEIVPESADWFYYLAVHCAFYSNRSMELLLQQWGYKSSLYHLPSRLWFFFEKDFEAIEAQYKRLDMRMPGEWFGQSGFVDYWK